MRRSFQHFKVLSANFMNEIHSLYPESNSIPKNTFISLLLISESSPLFVRAYWLERLAISSKISSEMNNLNMSLGEISLYFWKLGLGKGGASLLVLSLNLFAHNQASRAIFNVGLSCMAWFSGASKGSSDGSLIKWDSYPNSTSSILNSSRHSLSDRVLTLATLARKNIYI